MITAKVVRFIALIVWLTGEFVLGGCTSVPRAPLSAYPKVYGESPETIRTLGTDHQFSELTVASVAQRLRGLSAADAFTILALSGGGANGAFGAGALVGLARSGTRPRFSVVTGVSAGALIAPYAFLGPEWDRQLTDAYTGGLADHLLQPRGLGVLFGSSAYSGTPLKKLVDHYLSDTLIKAIAREAASGRLLLIATTNVDTGETVIWDLGSVAMNGGARAKTLIREILVASASVPGMFPPVIIRVEAHGATHDEAHVDGTASVPFIVPSAFLRIAERQDGAMPPPAVYVIVNGRLREDPLSVQLRFRSIMSRSISTGLTHMVRTTLELTATRRCNWMGQVLNTPRSRSRIQTLHRLTFALHTCASYSTTASNAPARGGCGSPPNTPSPMAELTTARSQIRTFHVRPMTILFSDLLNAELSALRVPTHRPGQYCFRYRHNLRLQHAAELLGKQSGSDAA